MSSSDTSNVLSCSMLRLSHQSKHTATKGISKPGTSRATINTNGQVN
jgi:hypothetical protein